MGLKAHDPIPTTTYFGAPNVFGGCPSRLTFVHLRWLLSRSFDVVATQSNHILPITLLDNLFTMWTVESFPDPVSDAAGFSNSNKSVHHSHSAVVLGRVPILSLLPSASQQTAFQEGDRVSRVALADFVARRIAHCSNDKNTTQQHDGYQVKVEPLDKFLATRSRRGKKKPSNGNSYAPYILERSDVWCNETDLHVVVRVIVSQSTNNGDDVYMMDEKKTDVTTNPAMMEQLVTNGATEFLSNCINNSVADDIMQHVACAVVQNRLRAQLASNKQVAFVADGSILPRKSGASTLPMASPPAIPFEAPKDSPTRQTLEVDMGSLAQYLPPSAACTRGESGTSVSFAGLVVPAGITLICGGGYHGKVRDARCRHSLV